jgi:tRNA (mo5U34)-methyltransferase
VLDVGAWDGYYSFLAERSGATRVVALDHYAWGVDLDARDHYWNQCRIDGTVPDHGRDTTDFWRGDLPGKAGFDLAHEVLGSRVESMVGDLLTIDTTTLGRFDVVLYLGVLYHVKEPLTALEQVRRVTGDGGVAVIETEAVWLRGLEGEPLAAFYAGDELNADFGNWYATNERALHAMCRAAGFGRVETVQGPPRLRRLGHVKRAMLRRPAIRRLNYRLLVHASP